MIMPGGRTEPLPYVLLFLPMVKIQFRVPKGHIVLRSNISYRRYIVNSAGIYIADFIFDEIIIVELLRYTRFARAIYFASQNAI